jgi:glucose/arabinose dehydrogenase
LRWQFTLDLEAVLSSPKRFFTVRGLGQGLKSAAAGFAITIISATLPVRAQDARFHNAPASVDSMKNPYAGKPDAVAAGYKLYAKNCVSCHGSKGDQSGNIPSLNAGDTQKAKDGQVFWFITRGAVSNGMPSWASLPAEQRWQLVTFLKSGKLKAGVQRETKASAQNSPANAPPPKPPFTDYRYEKPGTPHKIGIDDLPAPFATESAQNTPEIVDRKNSSPRAPAGFKVNLYATGLKNPRFLRVAPNGDIFVSEPLAGDIKVFRGISADSKPEETEVFASNLNQPYGIAFYPPGPDPQWVYVGNMDAVVRFPYHAGDMQSTHPPEHVVDLPHNSHHRTRSVEFSLDGKTMFVAIGSASNADDPDTHPAEKNRSNILAFNPDGSGMHTYASGIRNSGGGIAADPRSGDLWASVNERDALGDDLVPDYITRVQDGGFYGWPWFYIGSHPDPRLEGKHPELKDKVIIPDVLLQPHSASLQMVFYEGSQFPAEYKGDIFAAQHGSWNKSTRVGYEVIRVPRHQTSQASGEYEDFITGFVRDDGEVWGRPVGVAVANDGSLLISDDGSNSIWRVSYTGK